MKVTFGFGWLHTPDVICSFTGGFTQKHWYLDLICKRDYTNNLYLGGAFSESGKNVAVYILSTGVNINSKTLLNRVTQLHGNEDINGHGSALASIVAGSQYGIARSAHVYGLTLDYSNLRISLDESITIVLDHINTHNFKSVVLLDVLEVPDEFNNFRFTSDSDNALSLSVQRLLDLDIPTVACAKEGYYENDSWIGNLNLDFLPPINTTDVMAFVGFDQNLIHYPACNYGYSAFLYAPCAMVIIESLDNILSYNSHADYASAIGVGIIALCLSKNPKWGHRAVKSFLKKVSRINKIDNSKSYSYDVMFILGKDTVLDRQGNPITYTYPNFTMLTKDSVNAYFVKNILDFNSDVYLGEFNNNQTLSIPFTIFCKTFYDETKPYLIKIIATDCAFLKLDLANRLYGFVPVHKVDTYYNIVINISNGINALLKHLTLKIRSVPANSKVAAIQTLTKEKNWLDFNLIIEEIEKFNLDKQQNGLRTEIIRPISRDVAFYDHLSGRYSNFAKSSPITGEAIVATGSDTLYVLVAEDKKDRLISDSKIIDRINSQ